MTLRSAGLFALFLSLTLSSGSALAEQQWPDLLGTWEGHTEAIASGNTTHAGSGAAETPRLVDTKFIIHVNHQTGKSFSGTIESEGSHGQKSHFVGTFTDGQHTAKVVDKSGVHEFHLIGKNEFKFCYTESGRDGQAIGCGSFHRLLQ